MEFKETTVRSSLHPMVLRVIGEEQDINFFKELINDSSDLAGCCLSFSMNRPFETVWSKSEDFKLDGMTISEWSVAYKQLNAKYMGALVDNDYLLECNHELAKRLAVLTAYCEKIPEAIKELLAEVLVDTEQ